MFANRTVTTFVADTYVILGLQINAGGTATFTINGTSVGQITTAIAINPTIYPCVAFSSTNSVAKFVSVDWMYFRQDLT